jgi:hypothetical protein
MAKGSTLLRLTARLAVMFPIAALLFALPALAAGTGTGTPSLGSAGNFAVLADSTGLTCTRSTVTGPVGISSGNTPVTPTSCTMQHPQVAPGAYRDLLTASSGYAALAQSVCTPGNTMTGTLDGTTFASGGVYCLDAEAKTGTIQLDGSGPWTFLIVASGAGALTATNLTVNGSTPCNATWWAEQAVTLTTSTFQGTLLAGADITLTGTHVAGSVLATGAVTLKDSTVVGCQATGTGNGNGNGKDKDKEHCNQGVGNGPEGCDPGNSNQGDKSRSNDELGGTPGDPGRKGGNGK